MRSPPGASVENCARCWDWHRTRRSRAWRNSAGMGTRYRCRPRLRPEEVGPRSAAPSGIKWAWRSAMEADSLEIYEMWDAAPLAMPAHSRLFHLEPIGVGTAEVESLTSYVVRLAEMHTV